MTTLEDVARRAEVSRATVSRVINNHGYVRGEVRERVNAAIRATGYVPNMLARSMVTKRTQVIGLLIPEFYQERSDAGMSFYSIILHRVSRACSQHNYSLLLSILSQERQKQIAHGDLRAGYVDGFIGTGLTHDDPTVMRLLESGKPTVLIGHNPYYPELHSVDVDHFRGALTATSYLIAQGRRRIAFVTPPTRSINHNRMRDGYARALLQHGLPVDPSLIIEVDDSYDPHAALARLLGQPVLPDAIFASSDDIANAILAALRQRAVAVPEQMAVASFDDLPIAQRSEPPLTAVHQPVEELAERAVTLLLQAIEGHVTTPQHVLLPTELVRRASA